MKNNQKVTATVHPSLILIVANCIVGTDLKFLIPTQDFDKIEDPELKALIGNLQAEMETETGLALLGDPAALPAPDSALEKELLEFTARIINAAAKQGFVPSGDPNKWNDDVANVATFLYPVAEEAAAEQEMEPITAEEASTIVDTANETPQGQAAIDEAVAVVESETGVIVSPEEAVVMLPALAKAKAIGAASQINNAIQTRSVEAIEAIRDILELAGAQGVLLNKLSTAVNAELPAEAEA